MWSLLEHTKQKQPVVHCITNYVSANDVANTILAVGGVPIMAENIKEVGEVVVQASSLVLNMGMLNENKLASMIKAGETANRFNIPVVLDPVGCMVSDFRKKAVKELLNKVSFSVIKGNYSEMLSICERKTNNRGIDSFENDKKFVEQTETAEEIAKKYNCVAVVSGKTDIISDLKRTMCVSNGTSKMAQITGTGCMLSGIIGTFVGVCSDKTFEATALACAMISVAGELADKYIQKNELGTASMRIRMIDLFSTLTSETLKSNTKLSDIR